MREEKTNVQTLKRSNVKTLLLMPLLGGLLSFLAWPTSPLFFLIFIAWVPMFFLEDYLSQEGIKRSKTKLFFSSYLFFITWNLLCTWWLWYASVGGFFMANFINALLMCIPFMLFHLCKKRFGASVGYFSLIVFWLTFEYLHMRWELSWPWLNLGNVFAAYPSFVQWYSFTGDAGGALWVLLMNWLIYIEAKKISQNPPMIKDFPSLIKSYFTIVWKPALLFFLPILFSIIQYKSYEEKGKEVEVVVLQPNINPYKKFASATRTEHMDQFIEQSRSEITSSTDYVLWPETAIPHYIRMQKFDDYESIKKIRKLVEDFPRVSLVTGASTVYTYKTGEELSNTARKFRNGEQFYDTFNAAIQFENGQEEQFYKKSKLVPGAERMPYPAISKFLEKYMVNLGSIGGSLGVQEERGVFTNSRSTKIAPVICYESVFGEYSTGYIRNGAELIFIVTNDAWWENTAGHRHHLHYASLRAIESRRAIARSANTGVSCFVDQRGDIHQATTYNEAAVLNGRILANTELSFFVRWGSVLGRLSLFLSALLFLNLIASAMSNNFKMTGHKRKK